MAVTFTLPFIPALSLANATMSGAQLFFYNAGTTTPKTVYSNATLVTPHASPVVADANGRFAAIYLTPGASYRAILKDSGGTTIGDLDNFSAPLYTVAFGDITGVYTSNSSLNTAISAKANATSPSITGNVTATGSFIGSTTAASPGVITSGFYGYFNSANGASINGAGSSYDVSLINKSGNLALRVPTGTVNVQVVGSMTAAGVYSGSSTIGYSAGAGGQVTQATSKSTGVTLNTASGQITMNNAALAASTSVAFTLTNSQIAAYDTVQVCIASGGTASSYVVGVDAVSAGSCRFHVRNISAGSLGEALVLNFTVLTGKIA